MRDMLMVVGRVRMGMNVAIVLVLVGVRGLVSVLFGHRVSIRSGLVHAQPADPCDYSGC